MLRASTFDFRRVEPASRATQRLENLFDRSVMHSRIMPIAQTLRNPYIPNTMTAATSSSVPRTVLVAYDDSEYAVRALRHAIELASERPNTRLHVLTVHPPPDLHGSVRIHMTPERARQMAGEHDVAVLEAARAHLLAASPVPYVLEALEGEPAEVIARRARELGSAQIVMGTHGRGRVAAAMLGSVALGVVHRSEAPVTLVK